MTRSMKWFAVGALALSVGLAALLSPFASSSPDGLERIAEDKGFADRATENPVWKHSPFPDYVVRGIGNERVATGLAGAIGTLGLFGAAWLVARAMARRGHASATPGATGRE